MKDPERSKEMEDHGGCSNEPQLVRSPLRAAAAEFCSPVIQPPAAIGGQCSVIARPRYAVFFYAILSALPVFGWSQEKTPDAAGKPQISANEIVKTFKRPAANGFRIRGVPSTITRRGFVPRGPKPVLESPMEAQEVRVTPKQMVFQNILFRKDSTDFADEASRRQVGAIAEALVQMPDQRFLIEGHTCDLGTDAHNLALSYLRARAVETALRERGVMSGQVTVLGFGEQELVEKPDPQSPSAVQECVRAQSRRVVIRERSP